MKKKHKKTKLNEATATITTQYLDCILCKHGRGVRVNSQKPIRVFISNQVILSLILILFIKKKISMFRKNT